jgi:hypothetical protein
MQVIGFELTIVHYDTTYIKVRIILREPTFTKRHITLSLQTAKY